MSSDKKYVIYVFVEGPLSGWSVTRQDVLGNTSTSAKSSKCSRANSIPAWEWHVGWRPAGQVAPRGSPDSGTWDDGLFWGPGAADWMAGARSRRGRTAGADGH